MTLLFGAVARSGGEESSFDLADALGEAGIADSAWDWIAWARNDSCYVILRAPIEARAVVAGLESFTLRPVASTAKTLDDNRNVWISPAPSRREAPAAERAAALLETWQAEQWRGEEASELPAEVEEAAEAVPDIARRRERVRRGQSRGESPRESVLAAMGLIGATDSEGKQFRYRNLGAEADET